MSSSRPLPRPRRAKHPHPTPAAASDAPTPRPPAPALDLPAHPANAAQLSAFSHAAADVCAAHLAHLKANADYYPTRLQHIAHDRFAHLQSSEAAVQAKHAQRISKLERAVAEVEEAIRLDPKPESPEQFARDEMRMRNEASDARLEAVRLKEEVDELRERDAWLEAEVARLEQELSVPEPASMDSLILSMYRGLDFFFDPQPIDPPTPANRRMSTLTSASNLDQALAQDLPPLPEPVLPEEVFVISTATRDGKNLGLVQGWDAKVLTDALWAQLD